jgi:hypothetical protein
MPRVQGTIPNLVNGISQQAAALRLPTQFESVKNFYPTIIKGLRRRPRTSLVKIVGAVPGAKWHFINRDVTEQYAVAVRSSGIRVFRLSDGQEMTVNAPDGWGYLSGATSKDYKAVTVADYTYVLNTKKVVQLDPASATAPRPFEALINIQSGNYARTYQIRINGAVVAEYVTPDGTSALHYPQIATTEIAKRLYEDLTTTAPTNAAPWGIGIHQNALHIVNYSTNFNIAGEDGTNGNAMKIAKGSLNKFSDLPNYGAHGFTIEVANSSATQFDNMWVYADKGGTDQNSEVRWREIPKPGSVTALNATTMPYLLKRESNGTFTFFKADWDRMKCGDGDLTSPPPSFVGQQIKSIFFHRNRLGFLADENVILSRAGSYFDFWRTTTSTLLDDDPIDISSAHIKVSFMNHAIPFKDTLILFSDSTQFRMAGNDLLTPKTVSVRPLTEHLCSSAVTPVSLGRSIFFLGDTAEPGGFCSITEWAYESKTDRADSAEVTAHVPALIPRGAFMLLGSMNEGMLFVASEEKPSTLYTYRYYWNNEEKVQSAFVEWELDGNIAGGEVIDSILYLVIESAGQARLVRMNLDTAANDPYLDFAFSLDNAQVVTSTDSYPTPGVTRLPRPQIWHAEALVGTIYAGSVGNVGQKVDIVALESTYVDIAGEWPSGVQFLFGTPYLSEIEFSPFYYRNDQGATLSNGRLQILGLEMVFDTSSVFESAVYNYGRDPSIEKYNGTYLNPTGIVGEPRRGRYSISVLGRSDDLRVALRTSSHLPAAFVSASWKGIWTPYLREA